jgi:uncharacterized protein (DUF1810 family)
MLAIGLLLCFPSSVDSLILVAFLRELLVSRLRGAPARLASRFQFSVMPDPYNLQRFLDAQNDVYDDVVHELSSGRKTSHWMWFIFPQIHGLGLSSTARHFAISSLEEARAYLQHPVLGARIRECARLVNQIENASLEKIFGSPDHLKFRSSMTLFLRASDDGSADHQLFAAALEKYSRGKPDALTLSLLSR